MLGLGTLALLRHPEQLAAVATTLTRSGRPSRNCCAGCRSCTARFRGSPPPTVEIAGVTIPAGQLVFVSLPSGNRDPGFIDYPETLDIGRGASGHSGVRSWRAPLPRRPAGPYGDADRLPRAAASVPRSRWPNPSSEVTSGRFTSSTDCVLWRCRGENHWRTTDCVSPRELRDGDQ